MIEIIRTALASIVAVAAIRDMVIAGAAVLAILLAVWLHPIGAALAGLGTGGVIWFVTRPVPPSNTLGA